MSLTGSPLLFFHGTNQVFKQFAQPGHGQGIYFSTNAEYAGGYASARALTGGGSEVLYPSVLAIRNPLILNGQDRAVWDRYVNRGYSADDLAAGGHDGILVHYADGEIEAMVLSPDQVRSATSPDYRLGAAEPYAELTPASLRAALSPYFGTGFIERLEAMGLLRFVQTAYQLPPDLRDQLTGSQNQYLVKALVDNHERKAYLIAGNIVDGREGARMVLHELGGHFHLRDVIGRKAWRRLIARVKALASDDALVQQTIATVTKNYPTLPPSEERFWGEVIAHLVEQPDVLRMPWHQQLVIKIKAFLLRLGVGISWISTQDIAGFAAAGIRTMSRSGMRDPSATAGAHLVRAAREGLYSLARMGDRTATAAFRRWFGDSKVVDTKGRPLVVYHGTVVRDSVKAPGMGDIAAFDRLFTTQFRAPSLDTVGSWFSTSPGGSGAEMYSGRHEGSAIYPVYLSIKNPHVTTFQLMQRRARLLANGNDDGRPIGTAEVDAYRAWLRALGKDGITIEASGNEGSTEFDGQVAWVALEPAQIKSSIGNRGSFDPSDPHISFGLVAGRGSAAAVIDRALMEEACVVTYGSRTRLVELPVSSFLALTPPSGASGAKAHVEGLLSQDGPLKRIPELTIDANGAVVAATARHYAAAFRTMGFTSMPVLLTSQTIIWSHQSHRAEKPAWPQALIPHPEASDQSARLPFPLQELDAGAAYWLPDATRLAQSNPAFQRWFAGSKVVRPDGAPLVVFHGGAGDIEHFAAGSADVAQANGNATGAWGSYFTPSAKEASIYAEMRGADAAQVVVPVYLALRNPYVMQRDEWAAHTQAANRQITPTARREAAAAVRARLEADGFDGIVIRARGFNDEWVAFRPEQIKSAIGNSGDFDPSTPRIDRGRTAATGSASFRRWFGDSKVVDADGQPLVVYHGTDRATGGIHTFDVDATDDIGAHFGTADQANNFVSDTAGEIYPVFLSIRNPLRLEDHGAFNVDTVKPQLDALGVPELSGDTAHLKEGDYLRSRIEAAGYDGVVYLNRRERTSPYASATDDGLTNEQLSNLSDLEALALAPHLRDSYIAIRPFQIKSATGNTGAFASSDPRIDRRVDEGAGSATQSAAFKAWFRDSKATGPDGEPLVLYHGTGARFEAFNPDVTFDGGLYFTTVRDHAHEFGEMKTPNDVRVLEIFLSAQNPLEIDAEGGSFDEEMQKRLTREVQAGKASGAFDSIVVRNIDALGYGDLSDIWIALDPTQVRSTRANRGTFDPVDPRFDYRTDDQTESAAFRQWFGDSTVVDAEGKPLVVYHGGADTQHFNAPTFFTDSKAAADSYRLEKYGAEGGAVTEAYLRITKLATEDDVRAAAARAGVDDDDAEFDAWRLISPIYKDDRHLLVIDELRREGFDGAFFDSDYSFEGRGDQIINSWVVFSPEQIKSATGNRGTFSSEDPIDRRRGDGPQDVTASRAFQGWFKDSKVVDDHGRPLVVYHGTAADFAAFDPARVGQTYGLDKQGFFFAGRFEAAEAAADDAAGIGNWQKPYQGFGGNNQVDLYDDGGFEERDYDPGQATNRGQSVMPVYLSLQNPLVVQAPEGYAAGEWYEHGPEHPNDLLQRAKDEGHDGVIIRGAYRDYDQRSRLNYNRQGLMTEEHYQEAMRQLEAREARTREKDIYYIAFRPEQIKSATGNRGTFSSEEPRIDLRTGEQTQSAVFKRWFGDSKVMDADGKPLVVYHGTTADFSAFDPERVGESFGLDQDGFFFTGNTITASGFADPQSQFLAAGMSDPDALGRSPRSGANVIPAYLSLQNPLTLDEYTYAFDTTPKREIDDEGLSLIDYFDDNRRSIVAYAKEGGNDGVLFQRNGQTFAVAFRPEQIKSATGNRGTFDPNDPRIDFRLDEQTQPSTLKPWFGDSKVIAAPEAAQFASMYSNQYSRGEDGHADPKKLLWFEVSEYPIARLRDAVDTEWFKAEQQMWADEGEPDRFSDMLSAPLANPIVVYDDGSGGWTWDGNHRVGAIVTKGGVTIRALVGIHPAQIKSATGNRGAFDPEDPRIDFRRGAATESASFRRWFGDSKITRPNGAPLVVYHGTTADVSEFRSHSYEGVYRVDGVEISRADAWDMGDDYEGAPESYHYMAIGDAASIGADKALLLRTAEARDSTHPDTLRLLRDLRRLAGKKVVATTERRPSADGFYFTSSTSYAYVRDIGMHDGGNVVPVYLSIKNPVYLNASQIESAGLQWRMDRYIEQGYDGAIYAADPSDLTKHGIGGAPQIVAFRPEQVKSAIGNKGSFDPRSPRIDLRVGDITDSPRFVRWFEGSHVVDADGKPRRLYHGTGADFTSFETQPNGAFFAGDPAKAASFSGIRKGAPNVVPAYLCIRNPWRLVRYADDVPYTQMEDQSPAALMERGYDGIYDEDEDVWIALRPEQIKSAVGNSGRFDHENPRIDMRRGALTGDKEAVIDGHPDYLNTQEVTPMSALVDSRGQPIPPSGHGSETEGIVDRWRREAIETLRSPKALGAALIAGSGVLMSILESGPGAPGEVHHHYDQRGANITMIVDGGTSFRVAPVAADPSKRNELVQRGDPDELAAALTTLIEYESKRIMLSDTNTQRLSGSRQRYDNAIPLDRAIEQAVRDVCGKALSSAAPIATDGLRQDLLNRIRDADIETAIERRAQEIAPQVAAAAVHEAGLFIPPKPIVGAEAPMRQGQNIAADRCLTPAGRADAAFEATFGSSLWDWQPDDPELCQDPGFAP